MPEARTEVQGAAMRRTMAQLVFEKAYRSWLDSVGTSMGVQQKLMRHAQIATTMNVYGNSMMESKREANRKVVRMALRLTTGSENERAAEAALE